ncbi:MAG: lysophospholipid acyltransferase family protein [Bacteroidota bacterium]
MKKILSYILTPVHLVYFGLVLVVFHAYQWVALKLGGYAWHKRSVDYLNFFLQSSLLILGSRVRFRGHENLPTDRPLIVVANHQSLHDIPPFFWNMRKHHVKFVSKIELGKGIPSVSFNLRHGGSVLIDRKNPRQAIPALKAFGEYIEKNNYAAVIFPEGTRSRNGAPKAFSTKGLSALIKYAPSALIVPVSINHSWRLQLGFPMEVGVRPTWTVHPPVEPNGRAPQVVIEEVEQIIKAKILAGTSEKAAQT